MDAAISSLGRSIGVSVSSDDFEVKMNVQSPGPLELIGGGLGLLFLLIILHYIVGGKFDGKISFSGIKFKGETEGLLKRLQENKQSARNAELEKQLEELRETMDKLRMKIPDEITQQDRMKE
ncbi:hypothetical protein [Alicyclobacillus kakegawensis]|uniref:hypothetical protein n=1 Tax=Alicyclobacillus kakegawensis TaxID=392012 RepID=UPI0008357DF3|nr:hypothetical protein [Alicyclobacillus kakegawensis]